MRHATRLHRPRAIHAALTALAAALLCLATASQALAFPPAHARLKASDLTGLNHACGAATDSKGDLYASSAGEGKVKVFDPSHTLLTEVSNPNTPCALAITTTGSLYVSEQATGNVIRYAPSEYPPTASTTYTPTTIDASGNAKGIAVDPKDNRLYVAEGTKVALYKADGGFEANALEGKVGEATGVAAYTYVNTAPAGVSSIYLAVADSEGDVLKLFSAKTGTTAFKARRTVSGVDQDDDPETPDQQFGFGAQGAYLTADPGNESEAHACNQVGGQLCSADHLFLYDAAHEALDELDGYGSLVDQLDTAGLQDAQPTQVAVERSGGAGDGTVYVSSGASTAAKLFAFAPLKEPTREALPALSHVLAKARAVAVDERGDVYVTAEKLIRVYSPAGSQLTSFADSSTARDLAVDSSGHVYVVDSGTAAPPFTYYTPSKYPPDGSTTYTRHEPELLPSEAYESRGIQAVAVNPADDHAFLVGNNNFSPSILELAPPAEGSAVLGECGTGLTAFPSRLDIDVNATTGEVYFTTNPNHIYAVRCGSEPEFVRDVSGGGCPSGPFGANPAIAIDQANGHVLQFESGQPGASAREYDGAGGCVAQFGAFSSSPGGYKVAVDNSCADHEPPLTEQTTPTCKSFDPANGNAYVAFDGENNTTQPYDVSAFGPLSYPEVTPPEEFQLKVKLAGSGTGKVTGPGIDCGSDCTQLYEAGEEVTLSATEDPGSTFSGWSGAGCSGKGPCEVTISEAKEVTATFEEEEVTEPGIPLNVIVTGTGTVTSDSGLISCNPFCEDSYPKDTEVTLTASPGPNSLFVSWKHCDSGGINGRQCTVTMSQAKTVTATFAVAHALTLAKEAGSGPGSLSAYGLSCIANCSQATGLVKEGATVTVKATPAKHFHLASFQGDCTGTGPCEFAMGQDHEVKALFEENDRFELSLSKSGGGQAPVKTKPSGLNCSNTCSTQTASLYGGEAIEVAWKLNKGTASIDWGTGSGTCSGTKTEVEGKCSLTLTEDTKLKPELE